MPIIPWDRWFGLQSDKDAEIMRLKREVAHARSTAGKDARIAALEKQLQAALDKPVAPRTPARTPAVHRPRKVRGTPGPAKRPGLAVAPYLNPGDSPPSSPPVEHPAGPASTPPTAPGSPKVKEDR